MVGFFWLDPQQTSPQRRSPRRLELLQPFDRLEPRSLMAAGAAPTDLAQYMLELINRTRANPTAEGQRLLALAQTDPLIHQATANWNLTTFYQVISSYAPEPPLAFNPRLIDAALAETAAMLASNAQRHSPSGYLTTPAVAVDSDGAAYLALGAGSWATGENIYAYSQGVNTASPTAYADFFEAGFLLDWGNPNFGHLKNILAPGPSQANLAAGVYPFSEVGVGLVTNVTPTTPAAVNVGPAIVTQEFAWRQGVAYLTGTFSLDRDNNGFYSPGEGYGGVTIRAQGTGGQGTYQTQTWASGGYSLALPPGTYVVTASGPLPGVQVNTITIDSDNVGWSVGFNPDQAADIPVPADYDGVGQAELATYRPATGVWTINNPLFGAYQVQFGVPGDIPVPGHYDGGKSEIAVYRPSNGTWYIMDPRGVYSRQFGGFDSIPVPGDYDGDGRSDFAIYQPSSGFWSILQSGSGSLQLTQWGIPNYDQPVPAAYDGDGRTEIAVLRPRSYAWFVKSPTGLTTTQYGSAGMIPVPADYDGLGRAEVAVYQPATGTWYIQPTGRNVTFGLAGVDTPAPADFDGDGRVDISVFRSPTAEWFSQNSSLGATYNQFGQGGTGPTLRTLGATSLGVPGIWAGLIASPGSEQTGSVGPTTADSAATTGTAALAASSPARLLPTLTVTPKGSTLNPAAHPRNHSKWNRTSGSRAATASTPERTYFGRSRSLKNA